MNYPVVIHLAVRQSLVALLIVMVLAQTKRPSETVIYHLATVLFLAIFEALDSGLFRNL